jgi:hypothetical protein
MNARDTAQRKNQQLVEDLGCCPEGHYCTLKEILVRCPRDTRMLVLIKCLEKFKYERSKQERRDVNWNEALDLWIKEGRAEQFSRRFNKDLRIGELYSAVMEGSAEQQSGEGASS